MKSLFLGSGNFGLDALERLAGLQPGDVAVVTVPDAPGGRRGKMTPTPVKLKAQELGLPCLEVDSLKGKAGAEIARKSAAELVIICDFRLFLGSSFLAAPPLGCFNLHPSLLPLYRGAAPVARAVLAGDLDHGVTLHQTVKAMDAGPIVAQLPLRLPAKRDRESVASRLALMAADLLEEWLPRLADGNVPLTPQDHDRATPAPKLTKADGWVIWRAPSQKIENRVLSMSPWPRAFSRWHATEGADPVLLFLDRVIPEAGRSAARDPGFIRDSEPGQIRVACGPDGCDTIQILQLQRAGKKSLPAQEFQRGTRLVPGSMLISPVESGGSK